MHVMVCLGKEEVAKWGAIGRVYETTLTYTGSTTDMHVLLICV